VLGLREESVRSGAGGLVSTMTAKPTDSRCSLSAISKFARLEREIC
jgi:hypothetical protein